MLVVGRRRAGAEHRATTHRSRLPAYVVLVIVLAAAFVAGALLSNRSHSDRSERATRPPVAQNRPSSSPVTIAHRLPCPRPPAQAPAREQVARFHAVAAVRCITQVREIPGSGLWQVNERDLATTDLAALQAAYSRPNEARSMLPCPAIAIEVAPIALIDENGQVIVPAPPAGPCGVPARAVLQALSTVNWQPISVQKVSPFNS